MKSTDYQSAPPEVWDYVVAPFGFHVADELAYKAAGRKPIIPEADFMELTELTAQELHDNGQVIQPISPSNVALPAFSINLFFDSGGSRIGEIAQPKKPYRDDLYIYGLDALFVAGEDSIACKLTLYDTTDGSAGITDVGVIVLCDHGPEGFYAVPDVLDFDGLKFYDYESVTGLSHWLGYLWRGIQYRMIYRPELISVKHKRIGKETIEEAKKKIKGSKKVVKVQRIITISTDEDAPEKTTQENRQITVAVWGVSGHWRNYKSGKRTWVQPYRKGKDRDKEGAYCPKEYRFIEGVLE